MSRYRPGYTLIETLVTVGVIAILLGLTLPAIQAGREAARHVHCISNLKQIGLAQQSYEVANSCLPPFVLPGGIWCQNFRILPYCDEINKFNLFNINIDWYYEENFTATHATVAFFACPSGERMRSGFPLSSYPPSLGNGYGNGLFSNAERPISFADCTDGLAFTASTCEFPLVGDRPKSSPGESGAARAFTVSPATRSQLLLQCMNSQSTYSYTLMALGGPWFMPDGYTHVLGPGGVSCVGDNLETWTNAVSAGSRHTGAVNCLLGDGSARRVKFSVDLELWRALGSRNGREPSGDLDN